MFGIDKNINSKGTDQVEAPKQNCANRTGSRVHVFWRVTDKEESFNNFGDVYLENFARAPSQGSSEGGVVHGPVKLLEGYGAPADQTRGSRIAPSDRIRLPVRISKTVKFV